MPIVRKRCFALALSALVGCDDYHVCPAPPPALVAALPTRLSETGLYADLVAEALAPGVRPYAPSFELWSDGAAKRRWIALPTDAEIDTSNMDAWVFPRGTKLWKEFRRDGLRVETRLLEKVGDGEGDWAMMAYAWTPDGADAVAAPKGVVNALGTAHDVPAADRCLGCHGGRRSRVLGFSALQLAHADPADGWDLERLVAAGRLSVPPSASIAIPGSPVERAALGYLHANCSHCHNGDRPEAAGPRCFDPENDFDFFLSTARLGGVGETGVYRTVVGDAVEPGDPEGSKLFRLVSHRGEGQQMPPLATDAIDPAGVDALRAWIVSLPDR